MLKVISTNLKREMEGLADKGDEGAEG